MSEEYEGLRELRAELDRLLACLALFFIATGVALVCAALAVALLDYGAWFYVPLAPGLAAVLVGGHYAGKVIAIGMLRAVKAARPELNGGGE